MSLHAALPILRMPKFHARRHNIPEQLPCLLEIVDLSGSHRRSGPKSGSPDSVFTVLRKHLTRQPACRERESKETVMNMHTRIDLPKGVRHWTYDGSAIPDWVQSDVSGDVLPNGTFHINTPVGTARVQDRKSTRLNSSH